MKRRTIITTSATVGLAFLAGCSSAERTDSPTETATTWADGETTSQTDGDASDGPSVVVEPSTTALEYGADYSVAVTMEAGSEPIETRTEIWWDTEADPGWTSAPGTNAQWSISAGGSETKTFDIVPPSTGDVVFAVTDLDQFMDILDEWELTVEPPLAALDESISFYDGLTVTMGASLEDEIQASTESYGGQEAYDERAIRPGIDDARWLVLTIVVENESGNDDIRVPDHRDIDVLAAGNQLESQDLMFTTEPPLFEFVGDPPDPDREEYWVELQEEPGYYREYGSTSLAPNSFVEGWIPYVVSDSVALEDVAVLLEHGVRARWE
ncbi:hypothetical protein HSRCO_2156 [Halanaeroarchaeum sp. HSR-CO]|uniref:hypothetical protein n=1 Tax=Halanaeroarchaeum sp. HSR-CO TaxID=2866382 RepID=UPI00217E6E67|nr:hypothetical protein [Halanaeroarchaeum sp. HSR-CO]UWG48426.1 hypothetical protein HSRCO_2156 [Halanaeroarchaeum sp. HSR-CO]